MSKHSEWKVACNPIGGKKMYAPYRIIDVDAVDHSGNREYATGYTESREKAQAVADRLNAKSEQN